MSFSFEDERSEVIQGSRLKAAASVVLVAPVLFIHGGDPTLFAGNWALAVLGGGFALMRMIIPGRIVLDDRGITWRTMFGGGRLAWSEIAYAATGSTYRRWSRAYLELADADGSPALRRVWIPGSWTISQSELADRINAARERVMPNLTRQLARMMDEGSYDRLPVMPAAPVTALAPIAPAAPLARPAPAPISRPAAPVFGRRRNL